MGFQKLRLQYPTTMNRQKLEHSGKKKTTISYTLIVCFKYRHFATKTYGSNNELLERQKEQSHSNFKKDDLGKIINTER